MKELLTGPNGTLFHPHVLKELLFGMGQFIATQLQKRFLHKELGKLVFACGQAAIRYDNIDSCETPGLPEVDWEHQ